MIVLRRMLRDGRRAWLWWAGGLVALVLLSVAFYPSVRDQATFDELVQDLPEAVRSMIGARAGVPLTSPEGFLHGRLFSIMLPALLLVYGIGLGSRAIGGSEEAGTLELLLANPISRDRVLLERWAAVVTLLGGATLVALLSVLVLGPPFGVVEGIPLLYVVAACAGVGGLALLHAAIAFAVGAARGRRAPGIAAATTVALAGYLLQGLIATTDAVRPLRFASPWHWYLGRNMLVDGLAVEAVVAPVVLAAVLVLTGRFVFARRDLR